MTKSRSAVMAFGVGGSLLLLAAIMLGAPSACSTFTSAPAADPQSLLDAGGLDGGVGADGAVNADGSPSPPSTPHLYVVGGEAAGALLTANVQVADWQPDGGLSNWRLTKAVLDPVHNPVIIEAANALVEIGGEMPTGPGSASATDQTYAAAVNADGSLGDWIAQGPLDTPRFRHAGVRVGDRVYVIGGHSTKAPFELASTVMATITPNGVLGAWGAQAALPDARYQPAVAASAKFIFVVGGATFTTTEVCAKEVLFAAIDGGNGAVTEWKNAGRQYTIKAAGTFVRGDRLYVVGGWMCTGGSQKVFSMPINQDGTLGVERVERVLPTARFEHGLVVIGDWLYVIGGNDSNGPTSSVLAAHFDKDGMLEPWAEIAQLVGPTTNAGVVAH